MTEETRNSKSEILEKTEKDKPVEMPVFSDEEALSETESGDTREQAAAVSESETLSGDMTAPEEAAEEGQPEAEETETAEEEAAAPEDPSAADKAAEKDKEAAGDSAPKADGPVVPETEEDAERRKKKEDAAKNAVYAKAKEQMKIGKIPAYREAVSLFSTIPGWRDSDLQATLCFRKISEIKSNRKEKLKEILKILVTVVLTAIVVATVLTSIIPGVRYNSAVTRMYEGNYEGAAETFKALGDYGDSAEKLEFCEAVIREGNYEEACELEESGQFKEALPIFSDLGGYKDSSIRAAGIMDTIYSEACMLRAGGSLEAALADFEDLEQFRDSEQQAEELRQEIFEKTGIPVETALRPDGKNDEESSAAAIEEELEEQKRMQTLLIVLAIFVVILCAFAVPFYVRVIRPAILYRKAVKLMEAGCFEEALVIFRELEDYKDCRKKVRECERAILDRRYDAACQRMEAGEYEKAIEAFEALKGYRDSEEKIRQCKNAILDIAYDAAMKLKEEMRFPEAVAAFTELKGYRDSSFQASLCRIAIEKQPVYEEACELMEKDQRQEALALFRELKGYRDSGEKIKKIRNLYYHDALTLMKNGQYPEAISAFAALEGFRDSSTKIVECKELILRGKYNDAVFLMGQEEYEAAIDIFRVLRSYEDSAALMQKCRKSIRAPRPFNYLAEGMSIEETEAVYGKAIKTRQNREKNCTEVMFGNVRLMGAVGYLIVDYEESGAVSAFWQGDFSWEPYEHENEGLFPGIEFTKYKDYYTFLFGNCRSEYLEDNHKGAWWREPPLTVDVSGYDYVTIHFALKKQVEK